MQIYFVNLNRDTSRRQRMEAQLQRIGVEAERIEALLPQDLEAEIVAANCDASQPRYVSPAELACTLSHQRAWRRMLDAGLPYAAFLEDDVLLSDRLAPFLAAAEPLLGPIDILRIETNMPKVRVGPAEATIADLATVHRMHSVNFGCGGYILTRKAAEPLLNGLCPLNRPVDVTLFWPRVAAATQLEIRQAVPAPVANGSVMIALQGSDGPSNLQNARQARMDEQRSRRLRTVSHRIWGQRLWRRIDKGYVYARDAIRAPLNRYLRGIREVEIPLL